MISFEQALQATLQHAVWDLETETVALAEALARRLCQDVRSDTDWPATDRSAMDGFAVRAGDSGLGEGTSLQLVGECLAGRPFAGAVKDGQAIRIMTGAVVPATVGLCRPGRKHQRL